jgi:2-keto-4-pentenoate hydratase/2-oxohepta-3-ene-1,7-dioic acid hydratase in catechol pathway
MRLVSARINGRAGFGAAVGSSFVDFTVPMAGRCADLVELLASPALLAEAQALCNTAKPMCALGALEYLPVIHRPEARMFALGVAYKDHQLETGRADQEFPSMFSKHPQSLVGHGEALIRPRVSDKFDFEGEIVVVIGRPGRHIPVAEAMDHVAGYSILVDGSVRDWQKHSVTAGKNFDRSSSYGPWITTRDEIADHRKMVLTTRLNGQQMQHSGFDKLMWELPFVIHYVSTITCLQIGDSISTGTPAGVGHRRNPQVFMKPGDVLEVEVSGIGVLRNSIADEQ